MVNHDMMKYDFKEGVDFKGLMPKVAEEIESIGGSNEVVPMFGAEAMGSDSLEVADFAGLMDEE